MNQYFDRDTAIAFLASRGFNQMDIECILDLTGSVSKNGTMLWPAHAIRKLAGRAWWLDGAEIRASMPYAA
ncbi:hypothetical protein [uncultured Parvibaculum sp.]|uniref:hypothetical protein n=1 Tax=uncultured Parvibaculum sp. TaxID=291828 RepID=UPI0030EEA3C8|tara:strand:+ start:36274 stop:36486 length:213 start_codon:yes stop_codon:yes gene_type:complete